MTRTQHSGGVQLPWALWKFKNMALRWVKGQTKTTVNISVGLRMLLVFRRNLRRRLRDSFRRIPTSGILICQDGSIWHIQQTNDWCNILKRNCNKKRLCWQKFDVWEWGSRHGTSSKFRPLPFDSWVDPNKREKVPSESHECFSWSLHPCFSLLAHPPALAHSSPLPPDSSEIPESFGYDQPLWTTVNVSGHPL